MDPLSAYSSLEHTVIPWLALLLLDKVMFTVIITWESHTYWKPPWEPLSRRRCATLCMTRCMNSAGNAFRGYHLRAIVHEQWLFIDTAGLWIPVCLHGGKQVVATEHLAQAVYGRGRTPCESCESRCTCIPLFVHGAVQVHSMHTLIHPVATQSNAQCA